MYVNSPEFDSIPRKTLEGHRVSRGEPRVLRRILDELNPTEAMGRTGVMGCATSRPRIDRFAAMYARGHP